MKRHMETAKHKRGLEILAMQSGIADIMAAGQKRTTMVERSQWWKDHHGRRFFMKFAAEHLSLRTEEHLGNWCVIFSDSSIALTFPCSRTKNAAIINHAS